MNSHKYLDELWPKNNLKFSNFKFSKDQSMHFKDKLCIWIVFVIIGNKGLNVILESIIPHMFVLKKSLMFYID